MAKPPRIIGLDDFRLTPAALSRLAERPVRLSIQLTGETASKLSHLRPKKRDAVLRATLAAQLDRLRREFPAIDFVSRGKRKASWTIDAVAPAKQVVALATRRHVKDVTLDTIEGRQRRSRRKRLGWFCVWGIVAIQIEGQVSGNISIEDRLMLVKATTADDAERRLERVWMRYAKPYMNSRGYLVRWKLISIRDVYELFDQAIDPRGTEVYSKLRRVRIRPVLRWRFEQKRNRRNRVPT